MAKTFRIRVFGKAGCDKCAALNQRLDKLMAEPEWQDFEKEYHDLETEDGLIVFSEAECVNPQRIPAFVIARRRGDSAVYDPVPSAAPGRADAVCGKSRLFQYLGLQTDYSSTGVISPRMLAAVLAEAQAQ